MQISFWSIDLTKSCRWSSAVGKPAKASAGVFISNNSFTVGWRKVFKVDNLELLEHIQHSDTIISWRGLSLYWDVFQMCLNNRGIKLPLKCGLEIKGSNLLSHRFLQTIISVLLDRVNLFFLFCHSFFSPLFILSLHCFHQRIFGPEASVFPTLSTVTLVDRKNAGQRRVWGGSGIPHAEGKHNHCQEDTHAHTRANTAPTWPR